ncbi:MAG: type II toxin-antitoxin system VapC family toxin [Lentisphaerae bacterium]|nr:type II toxin-antitoxin system VapC family toxin [Lentisphaerota bacterium]
MKLLLDTNVLLWWLDDAPRLGAEARDAIAAPRSIVYVSAVTAWEITIKRSLGKLEIPENWSELVLGEPFRRLSVTWEHALDVGSLPDLHRDPFDRLLVAQARVEGLVLVTGDDIVTRYAVKTLQA